MSIMYNFYALQKWKKHFSNLYEIKEKNSDKMYSFKRKYLESISHLKPFPDLDSRIPD